MKGRHAVLRIGHPLLAANEVEEVRRRIGERPVSGEQFLTEPGKVHLADEPIEIPQILSLGDAGSCLSKACVSATEPVRRPSATSGTVASHQEEDPRPDVNACADGVGVLPRERRP